VALRETGLGMTAIAKQMGCTRQALYDCLAREKAQKVFA
jgi:DNA-binding phage protein